MKSEAVTTSRLKSCWSCGYIGGVVDRLAHCENTQCDVHDVFIPIRTWNRRAVPSDADVVQVIDREYLRKAFEDRTEPSIWEIARAIVAYLEGAR